jgi:branched-chain amino acid transport system permease protein
MEYVIQTIISALSLGSFYALGALGIGLLFSVLRLINFAHGDFITVGGYALILPSSAVVATAVIGDFHPILLIICIVGIVIVFALLSYFLVFQHVQTSSPATMMIVSFALGYTIQNLIVVIYGGRPKAINLFPELTGQIQLSDGVSVQILQLVTIAVTWILLIALVLFFKRTRAGVQMRAAAEDFRMARMLGVRGKQLIALAFVLSGALAGIMSLLFVTQKGVLKFDMGVSIMLFFFIATVIGGMGSLIGAVVGGYAVGITSVVLSAVLPDDIRPFKDAFVFLIVIIILLWRPQGLVLSKAARERV